MNEDALPDWLGRQLLHRAVVELGIPWDAAAVVRGPDVAAMARREIFQAIDLSIRIVVVMRRLLPRGMSGAAVDHHWRKVAYQIAAWAIVRGHAPDVDDDQDDHEPPQAVVGRERGPRGPRPGGGSAVTVEIVERKGGRRVPR